MRYFVSLLDAAATTAEIKLDRFDETRSTQERAGLLRIQARLATGDIVAVHDQAVVADLDERAASRAREDNLGLLERLREIGLGWRDIARLVGVSVPAVQKWRQGKSIAPENRQRLARIVAVLDVLEEEMVQDPASWLEIPVKADVRVTPLDLLAAGRDRLVVQFAGGHCAVDDLLDEYDSTWRSSRVDSGFETFADEDGHRSIRPRS